MNKYLTWAALAALAYPPVTAWFASCMRQQAYWTALTVGLAFELGRRKTQAA